MSEPVRFETGPAAGMPRQAAARPEMDAGAGAPRVVAIDLLRGLAVMGMVMVAYAGGWEHRFTFLTHAHWRGFAIADMIFPAFLFCEGAALPYALRRRAGQDGAAFGGHVLVYVLRRSAALVALGVFLNLLPGFDFAHVRLPGILQRIGLCHAIVGTGCVLVSRRDGPSVAALVTAIVVLLVGYAALLLGWDAPGCGRACFDSAHSLPAVVDRAVSGGFTLLTLLALMRLVPPGRQAPAWTRPVLAFGTNATLAFAGITLLDTLMQLPPGRAGSGHDLLAGAQAIPDARMASAAYSALLLLVLGAGLWQLYRRRIVVRI